jgi:hypothetical protein
MLWGSGPGGGTAYADSDSCAGSRYPDGSAITIGTTAATANCHSSSNRYTRSYGHTCADRYTGPNSAAHRHPCPRTDRHPGAHGDTHD